MRTEAAVGRWDDTITRRMATPGCPAIVTSAHLGAPMPLLDVFTRPVVATGSAAILSLGLITVVTSGQDVTRGPAVTAPTHDSVRIDESALAPPNVAQAQAAPLAEAADGLDALYAEIGLPVPGELVARSQRPGCAPSASSTTGTDSVAADAPVWTPDVTVAEANLADPGTAPEFQKRADIMAGHGMWIWQYTKTEGGNYQRMVDKAVTAGFDHLWVRVGDSRDGFYAREYLDELVPLAHAAGLDVIGWGFPFLHDPLADARWTVEAMNWVGPHGRGIDAYSPDIERETEGVKLSAKRAVVHLAALREATTMPIIATVYPATDWIWESGYPYAEMAPWIDGFASMDYWTCGDSGYRAHQTINRLAPLAPVHVIGQAFNGGRKAPPSDGETLRFLDTAVRDGAVGASWWVWQHVTDLQWNTIASYPWERAVASHARNPQPPIIPAG